MSTPAQRQAINIRLSIQKAIKDRVQTPNTAPSGRGYLGYVANSRPAWINYGRPDYDSSAHKYFASVEFPSIGAGNYEPTMVQVTCFSRWSDDPLGTELEEMLELFQAGFRQSDGLITLHDWSTKASPVALTDARLKVVNMDGRYGEPEGPARNVNPPEGCFGKALTWLVKVSPDDFLATRKRYV